MYYKFLQKNRCKIKPNLVFGFTLIELMVSVSIFTMVMVISMGTIITVMDANRKSQTLRAVLDNLNFAMEGMTRNIRFGYDYNCGGVGNTSLASDCLDNSVGANSIYITDSNGVRTAYSSSLGRIIKTIGGVDYPVTSPDITIQSLVFRVYGSYPYMGGATNDRIQPKVIIVVKGYSGVKPSIQTSFTLETVVSQRKLDFDAI